MDLEQLDLGNFSLRPGGGSSRYNRLKKGATGGLQQENVKQKQPAISPSGQEPVKRERIRYTPEQILKYAELYTQLPLELQESMCELLVKNNEGIEQPLVETQDGSKPDSDQKDWRNRNDEEKDDVALQRAEDVGQIAWRPQKGGLPIEEQAIRTVKGILNKLTPENFERMTLQLLEVLKQKNVLQQAIEYLFNKATGEPQFGPLYAELCCQLDRYLVVWEQQGELLLQENDPVKASANAESQQQHQQKKSKSQFKKILLNTCQEEYEKVFTQRNEIYKQKPENGNYEEQIAWEDRVIEAKKATVNIVKLISELFLKNMLPERVLHILINDLLKNFENNINQEGVGKVNEDNVEAVCQVITVAGEKLSKSMVKKQLDGYLQALTDFQKHKEISSRIKFIIQDVLDLKGKNWVQRRVVYQAKKIDDLRREAQIELNYQMPQQKNQAFVPLSSIQQPTKVLNEDELIPKFGDEILDQKIQKPQNKTQPQDNKQKQARPNTVNKQQQPQQKPKEVSKPAPITDPAVLKKKVQAAYREYIEIFDKAEFKLCIEELNNPSYNPKVVSLGVESMYDLTQQKDPNVVVEILIFLLKENIVSKEQFTVAITDMREQLPEYRSDYPFSISRLPLLFAQLVKQQCYSEDEIKEIASKQEEIEDDDTMQVFTEELEKQLQ